MPYNKELHKLKYVAQRFEDKYTKDPNSGCWLWFATRNQDGYGRFKFNGRLVGAHRFSLMLYKEVENSSLCVLHVCDNPCCINPDHLFFGTHKENMRDAWRKGRGYIPAVSGEQHYSTKLKIQDILDIREYSYNGISNPKIACKYGVSTSTIQLIVTRKTWKHV